MQPDSADFSSDNGNGRDAFGCHQHGLAEDAHIVAGHIDFFRKGSRAGAPGLVATPASERGFLLGLSLSGGHRRRIFSEHHSSLHDFDANGVYLRRFDEDYRADLEGSFDFILMEISTSALGMLAEQADAQGVTELRRTLAEPDPLLGGLLRTLFRSQLPRWGTPPLAHNSLLTDELSTAAAIHIVHRYGNGRNGANSCRQWLSVQQEARAKEMLDASAPGNIGISDLAAETGLSSRAFSQAFRLTVGATPHGWAMGRLMEKAQSMLLQAGMSPRDVGMACGFLDIMEFERAFRSATGLAPADWQRASRS